jgi:ABC-type polysaccharide/polyol phosphate transport system ATPase subunit
MNDPAPILTVDAVAKRFCRETARSLHYGIADIFHDLFPARKAEPRLRKGEFWALEHVSFTISPGEAVAIGGRNGAGKTTLLRLLARLLKPDFGSIVLAGTVNPVIELGQGLNPMLTGRENAEIGLAWRCGDRQSIGELVSDVATFAEVGTMFDTPVHSYSAGMRVRLAFAIAAIVPCDLLLLDEVLAVGDLGFQRKCIDHMRRHLDRGGALVLVSHNAVQMQALCRRGILIDQGRVVLDGKIEDCIDRMFELQRDDRTAVGGASQQNGPVTIDAVRVCGARDGEALISGEPAFLEIAFTANQCLSVRCSFVICTGDLSIRIASFTEPGISVVAAGSHVRRCQIPKLPLAHGNFGLRATVVDPETLIAHAHSGYESAPLEFRVEEPLSRASLLTRHLGQLLWIDHAWVGKSEDPTPTESGPVEAGSGGDIVNIHERMLPARDRQYQ